MPKNRAPASPAGPRASFRGARSRFAHRLEQREVTAGDLKARRDRWRMIRRRLALTASRAKTTWHGSNPIDAHIRATRRRFTPRAAQAIPTRDHFAQRNPQRQAIANDMNVVDQERSPTSMQPLVMPRDAFLFRPQPIHHATARCDRHAPFRCTRCSRARSTRTRPPSPRHALCTLAPR